MRFQLVRKFTTSTSFFRKESNPLPRGKDMLKGIKTIQCGALNTTDFRLYFCNENGPISAFHDIPLRSGGYNSEENLVTRVYNMIVEIPRWTIAKMEIATKEPLNPIKQDMKKGELRYVSNCFPHHGYIWNYGALPQTWENPYHIDPSTKCKGDNDPIDVLEIGSKVHKIGSIVPVKILGCFCVLDEGETDWKLLAIDMTDPLCNNLNGIMDIERQMPGFLSASKEWFQMYKIPKGSPPNKLAFDGAAKDAAFAHNVIEETHGYWCALSRKEIIPTDGLALERVLPQIAHRHFMITTEKAKNIVESRPKTEKSANVDPYVNKWHYVKIDK